MYAVHVAERGAAQSAANLENQIHIVADLDRRIGQIDSAIEEATRRGKTKIAVATMVGQRRARAALAGERNDAAGALTTLKAERASVAARGHQIETESAPIRYVAGLLGVDTDAERTIRWLIALMLVCCDPLAIALTAAASARQAPPRHD